MQAYSEYSCRFNVSFICSVCNPGLPFRRISASLITLIGGFVLCSTRVGSKQHVVSFFGFGR